MISLALLWFVLLPGGVMTLAYSNLNHLLGAFRDCHIGAQFFGPYLHLNPFQVPISLFTRDDLGQVPRLNLTPISPRSSCMVLIFALREEVVNSDISRSWAQKMEEARSSMNMGLNEENQLLKEYIRGYQVFLKTPREIAISQYFIILSPGKSEYIRNMLFICLDLNTLHKGIYYWITITEDSPSSDAESTVSLGSVYHVNFEYWSGMESKYLILNDLRLTSTQWSRGVFDRLRDDGPTKLVMPHLQPMEPEPDSWIPSSLCLHPPALKRLFNTFDPGCNRPHDFTDLYAHAISTILAQSLNRNLSDNDQRIEMSHNINYQNFWGTWVQFFRGSFLLHEQTNMPTLVFVETDEFNFISCSSAVIKQSWALYAKPFNNPTWWVLGSGICLVGISCGIISKKSVSAIEVLNVVLFWKWRVAFCLLEQVPGLQRLNRKLRLVLHVWLLAGIILTNGYRGIVVSDLTSPSPIQHTLLNYSETILQKFNIFTPGRHVQNQSSNCRVDIGALASEFGFALYFSFKTLLRVGWNESTLKGQLDYKMQLVLNNNTYQGKYGEVWDWPIWTCSGDPYWAVLEFKAAAPPCHDPQNRAAFVGYSTMLAKAQVILNQDEEGEPYKLWTEPWLQERKYWSFGHRHGPRPLRRLRQLIDMGIDGFWRGFQHWLQNRRMETHYDGTLLDKRVRVLKLSGNISTCFYLALGGWGLALFVFVAEQVSCRKTRVEGSDFTVNLVQTCYYWVFVFIDKARNLRQLFN